MRLFSCLIAALFICISARASDAVVVNGVPLAATERAALQRVGVQAQAGQWWYDSNTGAFGQAGGPTAGFLPAGLALGGALRADASGGGDGRYGGVFINGREIHPADIASLRAVLGQVIPGRYWVDATGTFGYEGGAALGNLQALAQSTRASRGGLRGSTPSTCGDDPSCRNTHSWLGDGYFSDGKTGCIVMEGEVTC